MLAGEITLSLSPTGPLPPSPAAAPASLQPTGAELSRFCHGRLCSRIWRSRTGSPLPLASKIPLKQAKVYEAQAVKNLGIRPGRISSDLWEMKHGRDELCSCPSLLSTQTAQATSSCPPGCQGGIAEQRLLELAGSGAERRGRQREERTLHVGRESAGAIAETLHSGDIIYRTQRDLVSKSH